MKLCLKKQLVDDYQGLLPKSKVRRPGTNHVSHKGEGSCQEGEETCPRTCPTETAQQTFDKMQNVKVNLQFPATAARSNRPFCDFALGPPVLLWTNSVHIVKLWQQSRRAQKPNIVDIVVPNRLLGRSVLGFLLPGETCFVLGLSSTSQPKSLRQEPTGRGRAPGGARRRKYAQFFASVVLASLWRKGVVTEGKCQGSQKHQA